MSCRRTVPSSKPCNSCSCSLRFQDWARETTCCPLVLEVPCTTRGDVHFVLSFLVDRWRNSCLPSFLDTCWRQTVERHPARDSSPSRHPAYTCQEQRSAGRWLSRSAHGGWSTFLGGNLCYQTTGSLPSSPPSRPAQRVVDFCPTPWG